MRSCKCKVTSSNPLWVLAYKKTLIMGQHVWVECSLTLEETQSNLSLGALGHESNNQEKKLALWKGTNALVKVKVSDAIILGDPLLAIEATKF